MSWQDEARANGYVRAAFNANSDAELARGMQNADKAVDMLDNMLSGIGRALTEPSPPPKTSSGGGGLGLLVAGAALAGGAYLLSKVFGSDDKPQSNGTSNNSASQKKSDYPETEW